jgi:hypothetical protein
MACEAVDVMIEDQKMVDIGDVAGPKERRLAPFGREDHFPPVEALFGRPPFFL